LVVGVLIFNYFKRVGTQTTELEELTEETTTEETQPAEGEVPGNLPEQYTVKASDNLWKIAEEHYGSGYNWVDIAQANNLTNPSHLLLGQQLKLPEVEAKKPTKVVDPGVNSITGDKYTVEEGDSLWKISIRAYGDGYQWPRIAQENSLSNPDHIEPGQVLTIPR